MIVSYNSKRGGNGVKKVSFFFSQLRASLYQSTWNLVQHPSKNISIIIMIPRRTWLDTLAALDDTHNQLNHPVLWYGYGWHTGLLWLKSSTKLCVYTHTYIRLSSPGAHTHTHTHNYIKGLYASYFSTLTFFLQKNNLIY